MIHRAPEPVAPLFAHPPDTPPRNDAAPSGNGASANRSNTSPDSTLARLLLTPPARNDSPAEMCVVAADRIAGHAKDLRARVLAFIVGQGPHGATDDEGEAVLGIKPQTYTSRRGELVALGPVVDSGRRRNAASGRPAAVWIASTLATSGPAASGGADGSEGAQL